MVVGRRLVNLVAKHKKAAITTIIGLIVGPIIGFLIIESITITPSDLVRDLETGDVSGFNRDRKQLKQQIVFDGIDPSCKDVTKANLNSVVILHSNLSNTNLQNSELQNAQISGDLSEIDLRNAILINADLSGAGLIDADLSDTEFLDANLSGANLGGAGLSHAIFDGADLTNTRLEFADLTNAFVLNSTLTNADLNLANLNGAVFDCSSLRTVINLAVANVSQIHIVDSNRNEVSSCN
jgi:uncharacterized protein YjbI with pentapeptide repeats